MIGRSLLFYLLDRHMKGMLDFSALTQPQLLHKSKSQEIFARKFLITSSRQIRRKWSQKIQDRQNSYQSDDSDLDFYKSHADQIGQMNSIVKIKRVKEKLFENRNEGPGHLSQKWFSIIEHRESNLGVPLQDAQQSRILQEQSFSDLSSFSEDQSDISFSSFLSDYSRESEKENEFNISENRLSFQSFLNQLANSTIQHSHPYPIITLASFSNNDESQENQALDQDQSEMYEYFINQYSYLKPLRRTLAN